METILTPKLIQKIESMLRHNKTFELHLEKGKPVIVEIKRSVVKDN